MANPSKGKIQTPADTFIDPLKIGYSGQDEGIQNHKKQKVITPSVLFVITNSLFKRLHGKNRFQ